MSTRMIRLTKTNKKWTKNHKIIEVLFQTIIFDNKGKKLAFNSRKYTITINPSLLNDEKVHDDILKEDYAQRFDADFVLMTGLLSQLTENLLHDFGGEKARL